MDICSLKNTSDVDRLGNEEEIMLQLMNQGFLKKEAICDKCSRAMTLRKKANNFVWRCRESNLRDCSTKSVRNGSWFSRTKLGFAQILKIFILHSKKASNKLIGEELEISGNTVIDFRNFIREQAVAYNKKHHKKLGGDDRVIQIDETAFHGKKYGRGEQKKEQKWFFGGVCVETKKIFGEFVVDRKARTLLSVLLHNVKKDSIIHSDDWSGYRKLKETFKDHKVVVHSRQFKSSDGTHTNNIEGVWAQSKLPLKISRGTTDSMLDGYIQEGIMRINVGSAYLEQILNTIKLDDNI